MAFSAVFPRMVDFSECDLLWDHSSHLSKETSYLLIVDSQCGFSISQLFFIFNEVLISKRLFRKSKITWTDQFNVFTHQMRLPGTKMPYCLVGEDKPEFSRQTFEGTKICIFRGMTLRISQNMLCYLCYKLVVLLKQQFQTTFENLVKSAVLHTSFQNGETQVNSKILKLIDNMR